MGENLRASQSPFMINGSVKLICDLKPSTVDKAWPDCVDRLDIRAGTGEILLQNLSKVHTHIYLNLGKLTET